MEDENPSPTSDQDRCCLFNRDHLAASQMDSAYVAGLSDHLVRDFMSQQGENCSGV